MTTHSPLPNSTFTQQRGSIAVLMALGVGVLVLMLSVIDIGFMYTTKREYQKAADLAAMAGAQALIDEDGVRSCTRAKDAATVNATINLSNPAIDPNYTPEVTCGEWNPRAENGPFITGFDNDAPSLNAVRTIIRGQPYGFFIPALFGRDPPEMWAEGTATTNQTLAALHIRSSLVEINGPGDQDNLIDSLCTLLATGSDCITVTGAGWNGLATADITLHTLAVKLGAGTVEELLNTQVTLDDLLTAAVNALPVAPEPGPGHTFLANLNSAVVNLGVITNLQDIRIGDLLNIAPGTQFSALDIGLNVAELAIASIQTATSNCAICVEAPIHIPGLASVDVYATVTEPPQMSAIGNPALAIIQGNPAGSTGPDRLYVNTAQARALLSIDVSSTTDLVTGLLDTVTNTLELGELVSVLNPLVGGDLYGTVAQLGTAVQNLLTGLLGCNGNCPTRKLLDDPQTIGKIDILIHAARGDAYVNDYSCGIPDGSNRSLNTHADKTLARVSIGNLETPPGNALSGDSEPQIKDATILDIGYVLYRPEHCPLLGLGPCSSGGEYCKRITNTATNSCSSNSWTTDKSQAQRVTTLALKIKAGTQTIGTTSPETLVYQAPLSPPITYLPQIKEAPSFEPMSSVPPVSGLLNQLNLQIVAEPAVPLSGLLNVAGGVITSVGNTLSVLDPAVDSLLSGLGVDLNAVDVGAHMSCGRAGATLVN